jgi:histidyl-tRNA synthetase
MVTKKPQPKPQPANPSGAKQVQTLRGFRDILPIEQPYWMTVREKVESLALAYGYERIDTPIIESTSLFVRSVGKQSDIVEKEMFTFEDRGGDSVSMRPEGTAALARAYVQHGMLNQPQPVKLFYWGPMFRYERPQAGRYRQHHQFGFEVFGDASPVHDAELISIAYLFYKELGVKTVIHVNSLGHDECRANYLGELIAYLKPKRSQLCEDCKRRYTKNPLRFLDCKADSCETLREGAPHIVDYLDDECKNHLMQVLEYLDDLQVPYVLDPYLVRGLDYYTRTVFEIMPAEEEIPPAPSAPEAVVQQETAAQHTAHVKDAGSKKLNEGQPVADDEEQISLPRHALGGGGRYDKLVEQLGGRPTPACGFGVGIERAVLQMKAQRIPPGDHGRADIFLAQLGDAARRKAFILFEEMRKSGMKVSANFSKGSLKSQLEIANRLGAKFTAIIGQQEVLDGTTLVRDMESGMQEIVAYDKAIASLQKKLGKG